MKLVIVTMEHTYWDNSLQGDVESLSKLLRGCVCVRENWTNILSCLNILLKYGKYAKKTHNCIDKWVCCPLTKFMTNSQLRKVNVPSTPKSPHYSCISIPPWTWERRAYCPWLGVIPWSNVCDCAKWYHKLSLSVFLFHFLAADTTLVHRYPGHVYFILEQVKHVRAMAEQLCQCSFSWWQRLALVTLPLTLLCSLKCQELDVRAFSCSISG